jgi:hypothetical protein
MKNKKESERTRPHTATATAKRFSSTIESTATIPAVYSRKFLPKSKNKTGCNIGYVQRTCQGLLISPNAANPAVYEDISPQCIGITDGRSKPIRRAVNAATATIQEVRVHHCCTDIPVP